MQVRASHSLRFHLAHALRNAGSGVCIALRLNARVTQRLTPVAFAITAGGVPSAPPHDLHFVVSRNQITNSDFHDLFAFFSGVPEGRLRSTRATKNKTNSASDGNSGNCLMAAAQNEPGPCGLSCFG